MAIELQIPGGEPLVKVDGKVEPRLHVVQCTRSLGGGRLDSCALEFDISATAGAPGTPGGDVGDVLAHRKLLHLLDGKQIEVLLPVQKKAVGKKKQTEPTVIHWGQAAIVRPQLGDELAVSLVSRMEPRHFGKPLRGRHSYGKLATGRIVESVYDRPCVFNPVIDGRVFPNMSTRTFSVDGHSQQGHPFLDEEAGRSTLAGRWLKEPKDVAEREAGTAPGKHLWTLPLAVAYLCGVLNPDQKFIVNPQLGDLLRLMLAEPDTLLRDFHLADGLRLPECLDKLLTPFGYVWWVELRPSVRTIKVGKKSEGERVFVYHQLAGEKLDPARTNNERLDVQLDCSSGAFNKLTLYGDRELVEGTFELVRCWSAGNDELVDEANIGINAPVWKENPDYQDAWRKWALNEAGDYVGLRDDISKPFDMQTIFPKQEDCLPRRRVFLPCLTQNPDKSPEGNRNGYHVEISGDAGETWEDLYKEPGAEEGDPGQVREFHECDILDRECGLRFMGAMPPTLLIEAGADARVRITAVLQSDRRLSAEVKRTGVARTAPYEIAETLTMEDRFGIRRVHESSIYYADVQSKARTADEADDTAAIKEVAERLLDAANLAQVRGSIVVTGINWSYDLGQVIEGIAGRDVYFNLDRQGKKFPLIDSLTYDVAEQTLTLGLATIEDEVRMPDRDRRRRGGRRG